MAAHMLPRTDDILSRAVNISVGVVDAGLGFTLSVSTFSSDRDIRTVARLSTGCCVRSRVKGMLPKWNGPYGDGPPSRNS